MSGWSWNSSTATSSDVVGGGAGCSSTASFLQSILQRELEAFSASDSLEDYLQQPLQRMCLGAFKGTVDLGKSVLSRLHAAPPAAAAPAASPGDRAAFAVDADLATAIAHTASFPMCVDPRSVDAVADGGGKGGGGKGGSGAGVSEKKRGKRAASPTSVAPLPRRSRPVAKQPDPPKNRSSTRR